MWIPYQGNHGWTKWTGICSCSGRLCRKVRTWSQWEINDVFYHRSWHDEAPAWYLVLVVLRCVLLAYSRKITLIPRLCLSTRLGKNMLVPWWAGHLHGISATTLQHFKKNISRKMEYYKRIVNFHSYTSFNSTSSLRCFLSSCLTHWHMVDSSPRLSAAAGLGARCCN